jgi:hypothetical protein
MAVMGADVLFIAGFGPIDRDVAESRALYRDSLGIHFNEDAGGYLHTGTLQGAKHFALWPLSQAAQSCLGSESWPDDVPVPQAWLEFEVDNVEKATADLESRGHQMLTKNKTEPWGQTVSRFLSPEGLLVGLTLTPSLRERANSEEKSMQHQVRDHYRLTRMCLFPKRSCKVLFATTSNSWLPRIFWKSYLLAENSATALPAWFTISILGSLLESSIPNMKEPSSSEAMPPSSVPSGS